MIFVTGAARSGTSLVTQILKRLGADLGDPDDVNSLYEHTIIRDAIIKPYLASIGCDPRGQKELPDTTRRLPEIEDLAEIIPPLFRPQPGPWCFKGAKLSLIWPVFHRAFPSAKWVIVRRSREEIVRSCLDTSFMTGRRGASGWRQWAIHHEREFERMKAADLNIIEVWPSKFIEDYDAFRPVAQFCRLIPNPYAVRKSIDPTRYRD